ncbi:MAG TPA: hypothetical protein VFQ66_00970 [Candidatus Limnocylindria bacterium]|nr:hypothetical protein [Candidatus Limnocylindria bacterium]
MDAPQLRPLGIGDIVDRVFSVYRQRPLLFIALAAVPYLALFLVIGGIALSFGSLLTPLGPYIDTLSDSLTVTTGTRPSVPITPAIGTAIVTLIVLAVIGGLISVLFLSVQIGSLVDAATARYLGRETTVGASFRAGLKVAPKIIATGLLLFLSLSVGWLLLFVLLALANNALIATLGILGGLVATVFVFASWLVAPVVAAVEPVGPLHAVRRSWWLSKGHRWRILGLQLLLVVLQLVLSTLISFIFVAAFISDSVVRLVLQNIVNVIATVLWAPIEWGTFTILYFDLRVRKEALDLQLAAEALPREV